MKHAALLGAGVVGAGVAAIMHDNAAYLEKSVGESVDLKYILELRDCSGEPWADKVVKDFSVIENDPEVSVVAECIGGVGVAYDFVKRALLAGKSAVTSNKQLIAEKGLELLSIAKEKGVFLLFEASVGGGIPLIRPLTNCLAANRIDRIYGIVNGTTNYILTQMIDCGQDFDTALKDAQKLGYAEANPTADVDGIDAMRKICILADLCFGSNVSPEKVPAEGIRSVTAEDVLFAGRLGYTVKLLAYAKRVGDERFTAFVAPMLVPKASLLANVGGVMNAVSVLGDAVGECLFYGAGAGRMPTASAMVADIIDAMRRGNGRKFIDWGPEEPERWEPPENVPFRWYVRYQNGCENTIMDNCASENGVCSGITTEAMTPAQLRERFGSTEILSAFRILD